MKTQKVFDCFEIEKALPGNESILDLITEADICGEGPPNDSKMSWSVRAEYRPDEYWGHNETVSNRIKTATEKIDKALLSLGCQHDEEVIISISW